MRNKLGSKYTQRSFFTIIIEQFPRRNLWSLGQTRSIPVPAIIHLCVAVAACHVLTWGPWPSKEVSYLGNWCPLPAQPPSPCSKGLRMWWSPWYAHSFLALDSRRVGFHMEGFSPFHYLLLPLTSALKWGDISRICQNFHLLSTWFQFILARKTVI